MGHSRTCTFQVNVNVNNVREYIYGAMNLKDIKGIICAEQEYQKEKGNTVINANFWAQTARGRNYLKGYDFGLMDINGKITLKNIDTMMPGNHASFIDRETFDKL